ncbi:hypothetical protein AK812_SmicGene7387 [Symbiodinium microadriaticum]|uniref:Uncharacterized protein n=1 Tax=Symbiodinium microadriaticum TaxID=2951 RepID=A0A1Q9ENV1_SYMMI|nr:hypothetical protein AK812_SmicGene7387 [Symbiodinium microadriaticum]
MLKGVKVGDLFGSVSYSSAVPGLLDYNQAVDVMKKSSMWAVSPPERFLEECEKEDPGEGVEMSLLVKNMTAAVFALEMYPYTLDTIFGLLMDEEEAWSLEYGNLKHPLQGWHHADADTEAKSPDSAPAEECYLVSNNTGKKLYTPANTYATFHFDSVWDDHKSRWRMCNRGIRTHIMSARNATNTPADGLRAQSREAFNKRLEEAKAGKGCKSRRSTINQGLEEAFANTAEDHKDLRDVSEVNREATGPLSRCALRALIAPQLCPRPQVSRCALHHNRVTGLHRSPVLLCALIVPHILVCRRSDYEQRITAAAWQEELQAERGSEGLGSAAKNVANHEFAAMQGHSAETASLRAGLYEVFPTSRGYIVQSQAMKWL